jgi:hypothetical protein
MRVSNVYGPNKLFAVHEFDQSFDLIINITEASGLRAISINGDWFFSDGFENEITDNSAI